MVATDTNNNAATAGAKDQAFFAEEASRQILVRVASVLQDPDLCDATFVVEDGSEKEEIKAPTQFMAMSSPYFKSILYPQQNPQRKEVNGEFLFIHVLGTFQTITNVFFRRPQEKSLALYNISSSLFFAISLSFLSAVFALMGAF